MNQGGFEPGYNKAQSEPKSIIKTEDNILPVTIKQLLTRNKTVEHIVQIDGKNCKQVTIIGRIINKEIETVNISYIITDGTGEYKIMEFQADESKKDNFIINDYIYVCGRLSLNNDNSIQAFSVQKITDPNLISYHLILSLYVHLGLTKGFTNIPILNENKIENQNFKLEDNKNLIYDEIIEFIRKQTLN